MSTHRPSGSLSRRGLIKAAGAAAVTGVAAPFIRAAEPVVSRPTRGPVLRIAHLTDIHVQPERKAAEGFAACLHHVQSQPEKPDFILNTGDSVMDSIGAGESRTREQWRVFGSVLKQENSLPIEQCIGNHDCWGLNRKESRTTGREPLYGKKWALDALGLARPYRSFDRAGWHFVILDSTLPQGDGYKGALDDEQFSWLQSDLRRVDPKVPVLVASHIPILSVCVFLGGENEKSGDWVIPAAWMHTDARRMKDLFLKHPNVRLCLSGHVHLVDRADYAGVTYLCNGAVCAGWWKGNYQECEPGYGLVDLCADGRFSHRYVTFGWKAAEA